MRKHTVEKISGRKFNSVLKKLTVLCSCMLAIFFAYTIGFNFYVSNINDSSNARHIDTEFSALKQYVNTHVNDIIMLESNMQSDANTAILYSIYRAGSKTASQPYVKRLTDKLVDYHEAYSGISGLFVAIPELDLVISEEGQCSIYTFCTMYMSEGIDNLLQSRFEGSSSGIFMGKGWSDYSMDVLRDVAYHYQRNNSYSMTIVALSRECLDNWLARQCAGKDMDVYLLTRDGEIYSQYVSGDATIAANDANVLYESGSAVLDLDGELCDVITGRIGQLNAVLLFRRNALSAVMASNRRALMLMGISFIAVAILLYAVIKRWFYKPLEGILNEYKVEKDSSADEYMRLGRFMKNMHMNLKSMETRISENEQYARRITSDALNAMSWEQSCAFMDESQRFSVFTLTMEDGTGAFLMSDCRKFCLALGAKFKVNMVYDRTDVCTGVICYDDEELMLYEVESLLEEYAAGKAFVRMGVSHGHRDVQHMAVAHEECSNAFFSSGAQTLAVFSPNASACSRCFAVSLAQQATLASCVAAGDESDVVGCLDEIYAANEGVDNFWRLRMSGFLLDLLTILASNHDVSVDDVFDSRAAWTRTHNVALLTERVYGAYRRLAAMLGGTHDSVVDAIKCYVDEHLGDDISLSDAAQHVNRSYNYISMRFSEVTGTMFSEYVQKRRITRACELLCQTQRPVAEIAACVGYRIPSSFIRLFKKEMGMTPGQYRENYGKRASEAR